MEPIPVPNDPGTQTNRDPDRTIQFVVPKRCSIPGNMGLAFEFEAKVGLARALKWSDSSSFNKPIVTSS